MIKKTLLTGILALGALFIGHSASAMANPAATKCIADGASYSLNNNVGTCTFSSGVTCEEWAYFRGECNPNAPINPIICTAIYQPVCGQKTIYCIKAPCDPIQRTYANNCMLGADNATFLYSGECRADPVPTPATICTIPYQKLYRGVSGTAVTYLQEFLDAKFTGIIGTIDGVFGRKTLAALAAYQASQNLTADGVFGPRTRSIMCTTGISVIQ
ncbi:MAG: hypothetical protein JWM20_494 [Patescibacteria group bacterium]|nr:hypothetical protein [Patescibacteria group bacterium]